MASISRGLGLFTSLFEGNLPAVIGMIHVKALPGSPKFHGASMNEIVEYACSEAKLYVECGVDGILLENMHDTPYLNRDAGPEVVASMTAVCSSVKRIIGNMPCGIQILAGCNKQAMAVAKACDLDYIRAEGFVFSHVADEGLMSSDAGYLLRYRKKIHAENVMIFTDIKKKHSSHSITKDLGLLDVARAADFFLSDGVILTGSHTGDSVNKEHVESLQHTHFRLPILIGSGVNEENLPDFMNTHALIVGSHFKESGHWQNDMDKKRLSSFMRKIDHLRSSSTARDQQAQVPQFVAASKDVPNNAEPLFQD